VKISARNIFQGPILQITPGSVNAEVTVDIGGGQKITAIVTLGSVTTLDLALGKKVYALVKASSVLVMLEAGDLRLTARNCLPGIIAQVVEGQVEAEVSILLAAGAKVHAVVTQAAVKDLGLRSGLAATAVIKASSVLLGVCP
jgi:molybdate transport system regulatory protein